MKIRSHKDGSKYPITQTGASPEALDMAKLDDAARERLITGNLKGTTTKTDPLGQLHDKVCECGHKLYMHGKYRGTGVCLATGCHHNIHPFKEKGTGKTDKQLAAELTATDSKEPDLMRYAKIFFVRNLIRPNEHDYYAGKTGKNPHGISDAVWRQAYEWARQTGNLTLDDPSPNHSIS